MTEVALCSKRAMSIVNREICILTFNLLILVGKVDCEVCRMLLVVSTFCRVLCKSEECAVKYVQKPLTEKNGNVIKKDERSSLMKEGIC